MEIEAKKPPILPDTFVEPFTVEQMEMYLLAVYSGSITTNALSVAYHEKIGVLLEQAIVIGLGGRTPDNYAHELYDIYRKLRSNIYIFSAAKQYQQVRTMTKFIEQKGIKSTFKEFKALAEVTFKEYNVQYLKTEYITSIGQSQMAREWQEAKQKEDIFPMLEYRTQRDSRVRDEHAALDGITLPINHPFWNSYMPKNGFRCRCFTVSHEKKKATDLQSRDLSELNDEKKFPKVFQMNPGKDGLVFNPKFHPYFFVAKGDAGLRANHFNLPIP